jgi:hypothetical protein
MTSTVSTREPVIGNREMGLIKDAAAPIVGVSAAHAATNVAASHLAAHAAAGATGKALCCKAAVVVAANPVGLAVVLTAAAGYAIYKWLDDL